MDQIIIGGKLLYLGHCPVPTCEAKQFTAKTEAGVRTLIRAHLTKNLEDPIHSDIAEKEGWFDTDPLGD